MADDAELERQLRSFGATLQHHVGEPIQAPRLAAAPSASMATGLDSGDRDGRSGWSRRWMAVAAAVVLVVAGVVVLATVRAGDTPDPTPATDTDVSMPTPTTTGTDVPASVVVDGDSVIDPTRLRFAEPLPDGTASYFDDPTLPAPQLITPTSGGGGPSSNPDGGGTDSVRLVVMDGTRFVMRAVVVDVADSGVEPTGETVDIGVEGARYVDADRGAIAIPLDTGTRLVGPEEYFTFGGGGPFVEANELVDLATVIGQRPIGDIDAVAGIYVFDGSIDGEPIGVFTPDNVTVKQGPATGPFYQTTLIRFPEPLTAIDLTALVRAFNRGQIDPAEVGDVTFTAGPAAYIELVSPVDLLLAFAPSDLGDTLDTLIFVPISDLE